MKQYHTYMMASRTGTLYVGVTGDLEQRVLQHKSHVFKGFTSKYHVTKLDWFEEFHDIHEATLAEKTIKGWRRSKKIVLIEEQNPEWRDLAAEWFPVATEIPRRTSE